MITYSLGSDVVAFTTDRTEGRDPSVICPMLNIPDACFLRPHQVHGTKVMRITEEDIKAFPAAGPHEWECDAVIYNVRNTCVGISTADCIPVICYDPEHHCAAAIHADWRGTVARIVVNAIERMRATFGTDPTLLRCAIGPGISLESFEVGDEVYQAFADAGFDMCRIAKRYPVRVASTQEDAQQIVNSKLPNSKLKWHLDIKECNRQQLLSSGVPAQNITVSDIDTMTDARFFSARREGAATGRILTGIVLK